MNESRAEIEDCTVLGCGCSNWLRGVALRPASPHRNHVPLYIWHVRRRRLCSIRHLNTDLENSLVAVRFCYDLGQTMTREGTVDLPGRVASRVMAGNSLCSIPSLSWVDS